MEKKHKSPNHPAEHWERVFHDEFKAESDRACVILAAALLDSALETVLRAHLLPSSTSEDPLFDGVNAPLATFNARIEIACRLGLVSATMARNLQLIRKIRNDFAHNVTGCTFSDSSVLGRLTELRRSTCIPEKVPLKRKSYPPGPRGDFQIIISWIQWHLRSLAERVPVAGIGGALPGTCSIDEEKLMKELKAKSSSSDNSPAE